MGQHKTNPTAIAAKEGKLPAKEKTKKMTDAELQTLVTYYMTHRIFGRGSSKW